MELKIYGQIVSHQTRNIKDSIKRVQPVLPRLVPFHPHYHQVRFDFIDYEGPVFLRLTQVTRYSKVHDLFHGNIVL